MAKRAIERAIVALWPVRLGDAENWNARLAECDHVLVIGSAIARMAVARGSLFCNECLAAGATA